MINGINGVGFPPLIRNGQMHDLFKEKLHRLIKRRVVSGVMVCVVHLDRTVKAASLRSKPIPGGKLHVQFVKRIGYFNLIIPLNFVFLFTVSNLKKTSNQTRQFFAKPHWQRFVRPIVVVQKVIESCSDNHSIFFCMKLLTYLNIFKNNFREVSKSMRGTPCKVLPNLILLFGRWSLKQVDQWIIKMNQISKITKTGYAVKMSEKRRYAIHVLVYS